MWIGFVVPVVYALVEGTTPAHAWGASGHQAVGYVAQAFLASEALSFVESSLGSTYNESLGIAAPWADNIKSSSSYAWASELHYVDALDDPPDECSVEETRDCASGKCILTAISNYTTRVVTTSLSATQRQEALKFLDHFIGDIGQPLHVENFETGGNGVSVKCSGSTTNLHSVWDSGIINKLLSANYSSSVTTWASTLTTRIKTGAYASKKSSWISCSSTTEPATKRSSLTLEEDIKRHLSSRAITPLECPLEWARDSNAINCDFLFTYDEFSDLCTTSYYTQAVPIIEEQIAKQGYRLAAWLNVLFDGSTSL